MSIVLQRLTRAMTERRATPLELALADWALRHGADEEVAWAWAQCAHATAAGHSCLPLASAQTEIPDETALFEQAQFEQALGDSPLVGGPGSATPLIIDDGRLYLHRYWTHETRLAERLGRLLDGSADAVDTAPLSAAGGLFDYDWVKADQTHWQATAAFVALRHRLAVISGGPGTGKTYTVLRLMLLLIESALAARQPPPLIRLAAPTGKAAARMLESTRAGLQTMTLTPRTLQHLPTEAQTLHRLIGLGGRNPRPRHDRDNPLPADVVIVDEASMIDLPMMARLTEALPDGARLVLLGDRFQLASVESGSVLAELCNAAGINSFTPGQQQAAGDLIRGAMDSGDTRLSDHVVTLQTSHRFQVDSPIGQLATAVNAGDTDLTLKVLRAQTPGVRLIEQTRTNNGNHLTELLNESVQHAQRLISAADPDHALKELQTRCLLCAVRRGPTGSETLNRKITETLAHQQGFNPDRVWFHGRPVIVSRNDYRAGLFNGDTGLCLRDADGQLRVWFRTEDGLRAFLPTTLPEHESAYAMTVHKSQGSEFTHVSLVLPADDSPVLSRELLYTGITRARDSLTLMAGEAVLRQTVARRIQRHSGLAARLLSPEQDRGADEAHDD